MEIKNGRCSIRDRDHGKVFGQSSTMEKIDGEYSTKKAAFASATVAPSMTIHEMHVSVAGAEDSGAPSKAIEPPAFLVV